MLVCRSMFERRSRLCWLLDLGGWRGKMGDSVLELDLRGNLV